VLLFVVMGAVGAVVDVFGELGVVDVVGVVKGLSVLAGIEQYTNVSNG